MNNLDGNVTTKGGMVKKNLGQIAGDLWNKVPKVGVGTWGAMVRQGFKEIRAALYPDSNIAQPTEHGIYGTATQGEIAQNRREEQPTRSTLDEHVQRAESEVEQKQQSRARGSRDHGSPEQQTERDREGPELEME